MSDMPTDSSLTPETTGVLIVGAGPTGLTLAIELARRDVAFRLIDDDPSRLDTSRALGTQARTIEVFDLMGIPPSALTPAIRLRAFRLAERERTLARVPIGGQPPYGLGLLIMAESETERMLEARLRDLGGRVERDATLTGFQVENDGVTATIDQAGAAREVRARFLVGADGAKSTVRTLAGIPFIGSAYPERFLLADVELDWALPHDEGHVWIGDDGLVAVLPLPEPRRFRLIIPLPASELESTFATEHAMAERAEALLRARTGVPFGRIGEPVWASSFRIIRRQAERYRKGPVFLAGDAAHVHSPVGGQGMNTGIQDAFNLGWKLALAVQGEAAPGLLETYEAERHPVARDVLRGTNAGTRLVLAGNPVVRAIRERALPLAVSQPLVRRRLIASLSQLEINYRRSFLSVDADGAAGRGRLSRDRPGLQAGDRVPDGPLLRAPEGEAVALFDLIARGWVLFLFPGDTLEAERVDELEARARETREMVGERALPCVVLGSAPEREFTVPALLDATGEVSRAFGARGGLVALIRPDGYLGYRGRPDQAGELASYLARAFAMSMRE